MTSIAKRSEEINCVFCKCSQSVNYEKDNENTNSLFLGKMLKYNKIYAHYNCLLLSSGLSQNGKDNEGMFGFLYKDINIELKRGKKLKCSFCKSNGSTIGCANRKCKKCFHLPCGLKNNILGQFFGSFNSYCVNHRPKQSLEKIESKELNEKCAICYLNVQFDSGFNVLLTPCCYKLFHRNCLQTQALSAGYFFKCPLCNNTNDFKEEMILFGIYIPKRDASWETNNAFGELYERHSSCDQLICICPQGRNHNQESGVWKLFICNTCGSQGVHMKCALITDQNTVWVCDDCKRVEQNNNEKNKTKRPFIESKREENENEIEIIDQINIPTSSGLSNRKSFTPLYDSSIRKRIRLSTNCGQIEIDGDRQRTKVLSNTIDWNSSKKETIISQNNDSKDVIEIENSDDDECIIIEKPFD